MKRYFAMIVGAVALAGCVSVLPEQKVAEGLYRLGPMEAAHELKATVIVREPEGSRLVGGRSIASEGSDGAVRYVPGVEWADAATRMMQVALLDQLGEGPDGATAMAAGTSGSGDYEVSWRISDFSLAGETARCRLEVTLLDGRSRVPLAQRVVTTSQQAGGVSNGARALALKDAGRACVSEVANFVAERAVAVDRNKAAGR